MSMPVGHTTTQRPQSTPRIRIEVDGRVVEGFEGQTILEVCRDNGIEIPTLCYEPKLPGFGACRMCVVDVEGEEHPPISCSRAAEPDMVVKTQTDDIRRPYIKQLLVKGLKFPLPHRINKKAGKKVFASKRPSTFF